MIALLLLVMLAQPASEVTSTAPLTFNFNWEPADETHDGFILEYNPPGHGNRWEVMLKLSREARNYTVIEHRRGRHCYRWRAFNQDGISPPATQYCGRN